MKKKRKPEHIEPCPFCGKVPDGNRFVSTTYGPALICEHCSANGPASEWPKEQSGLEFERHRRGAVRQWNQRARDAASWRRGVESAAEFVQSFDKYVDHDNRLSDCILAKFNLIGKRPIRKNGRPSVAVLCAAIDYYQKTFTGTRAGVKDKLRSLNRFLAEMKKLHTAR